MDVDALLEQLSQDVERMADVVAGADPDAQVPTCPGWRIRDLVQHLAGVHAWALIFVSEARMEPVRTGREDLVGGWPADEGLADWFRAGGQRLVEALANAPLDLTAWTFLPATDARTHWARRQTHETAIHRIDAELSANVAPLEFSGTLATDGIDELVCAFLARPRRGPRFATETSLSVACTDSPGAWTVSFGPDSSTTALGVSPDAAATVTGRATDLYRWAWNRQGDEAVTIEGNHDVTAAWRKTIHAPR